jgi:hypothetical protein
MKYSLCHQMMKESVSLFMFLQTMKDKNEETATEQIIQK